MADIPANSNYLSVHSPTDASFDTHKKCSCKTAALYAKDTGDGYKAFMSGKKVVSFANISTRMLSCGSWLKFAEYESGKLKLIEARFCKTPNCPMCQWRRSLMMRAKFLAALPEIKADYPKHRWIFLTLTVKNCTVLELKATLKHMRESYKRFRQLADYPFEGYIRSIEVTRVWDWYDAQGTFLGRHGTKWYYQSKEGDKHEWRAEPTNLVHPHFHVLGMVPASYFGLSYVKQERWAEMWQKSLRVEYKPVVDVRVVKAKKGGAGEITPENLAQDDTGLIQGICETMKYTVKEQDLIGSLSINDDVNSQWLKDYTEQMYKARRVEYSGLCKIYLKEEEEENENLIKSGVEENDTDKVIRERVYCFSDKLERYIHTSNREQKELFSKH
jgi:plasmid rolling circle replication initiator protein Rep